MEFNAKVRTCLWFDNQIEEAAKFYVSLLPDSTIENTVQPDPSGHALVIEFTIGGTPFMLLNGGPMFKHSEAASISVLTEDQEETDRLWNALTADGGCESQCGWLKDRYGVSWQIVPKALPRLMGDPDKEAAGRAMQAMMKMVKIDIAALQEAFDTVPGGDTVPVVT